MCVCVCVAHLKVRVGSLLKLSWTREQHSSSGSGTSVYLLSHYTSLLLSVGLMFVFEAGFLSLALGVLGLVL